MWLRIKEWFGGMKDKVMGLYEGHKVCLIAGGLMLLAFIIAALV